MGKLKQFPFKCVIFAQNLEKTFTMKRDRHIFQLIETEYRRQLKGI